jgi:molecular chaperone HtpG
MRLFLRRMHLCDNATELLPPWANFVNGLLNSDELEPNAARDNFMRDQAAIDLQHQLGQCVIAHLEGLKTTNRTRLSEILSYHELGIQAACDYHDDFFAKFVKILEWRVNPKAPLPEDLRRYRRNFDADEDAIRVTLPDLFNALPSPADGGTKRLSYFASHMARSQFFEMADAAQTLVLDASGPFEDGLLRKWARTLEGGVNLVRVGQVDDPALYGELDAVADASVARLAESMSRVISPGGKTRVEVTARRIKPDTLVAILRDEEQMQGLQKAYNLLNDSNTSSELKRMAEDMIRMARNTDMKMVINATNPMVRGLAQLCDRPDFFSPSNSDLRDEATELMLGLYNSALLSNQRMLSSQNARIFHDQYQRLMSRVIQSRDETHALRQENEILKQQVAVFKPSKSNTLKDENTPLRGFYITPFDTRFDKVRKAMKELMVERFMCTFEDATQRTLNGRIGENVKAHIRNADFFVIDITGPAVGQMNPNVMIELGAIDMYRADAPILPIAGVENKGQKFELPADIRELIYTPYVFDNDIDTMKVKWLEAFESNTAFTQLLKSRPSIIISPELVCKASGNLLSQQNHPDVLKRLCNALPTLSDWQNTTDEKVRDLLGGGIFGGLATELRNAVIDLAGKARQ